MYGQTLLDHFRNPRNAGELAPPAVCVQVSNPACGDILRLSARIDEGRVREARYKVRGCTASIAAGSWLTEWLTGRSTGQLAGFDAGELAEALELAPESRHAALLCRDAVHSLAVAAAALR